MKRSLCAFPLSPPPGGETLEGAPVNLWYDAERSFLVDTGYEGEGSFLKGIAELKWIYLTHHHPDHSGNIALLRRRFPQARWVIPSPKKLGLKGGEWFVVPKDGNTYGPLRALHTPGHTHDHFAYYDPLTQGLFSGDLILGSGTPWVGPPEGNMREYLESLERVRTLPLAHLYPGHGSPCGPEQLHWTIAHRKGRLKEICSLLKEHPGMSAEELVEELYEKQEGLRFPPMQKVAALLTMEGYLQYLEEEGVVERKETRFFLRKAV